MTNLIERNLSELPGEIEQAAERIRNVVRETCLLPSPVFSELSGANVYFKLENLQETGSFKIRGAANKFLSLPESDRGLNVAASTGNHGKAVAKVAEQFDAKCKIFSPTNALENKLDAIRKYGAEVILAGGDCVEAEAAAREFAVENSANYLSPYNDPAVVAGQGTIGLELCKQLENIDVVLASVGGGGMLSGISSVVREKNPGCEIVACSPRNSCVMIQSLDAGELLDLPSEETWSDGTAGGVETGSITFGLCQHLIQKTSLVSEEEIAKAMCKFIDSHGMLIEGSAAVAIASLLQNKDEWRGKNVVVVLCGANIGSSQLNEILSAGVGN